MTNVFSSNPIFMRYWRSEMRPQVFYPLLGVLLLIITLVFVFNAQNNETPSLISMLTIQIIVLQGIGGLSIYLAVNKEKDSKMYDFYLVSPLSAKKQFLGFMFGSSVRYIMLSLIMVPVVLFVAFINEMPFSFYPTYFVLLITSTVLIYTLITYLAVALKGNLIFIGLIIIMVNLISANLTFSGLWYYDDVASFFANFLFLPHLAIKFNFASEYLFDEPNIKNSAFLILFFISILQQLVFTYIIGKAAIERIKQNNYCIDRVIVLIFTVLSTIFMLLASLARLIALNNKEEFGTSNMSGSLIVFISLLVILNIIFTISVMPSREKLIKWAARLKENTKKNPVVTYIQNYILGKDNPAVDISLVIGILVMICTWILMFIGYKYGNFQISDFSTSGTSGNIQQINDAIFNDHPKTAILLASLHYAFVIITAGCLTQFFIIAFQKYSVLYAALTFGILWIIIPTAGLILNMNHIFISFFPFVFINIDQVIISFILAMLSMFIAIVAVNRFKKRYSNI